MTELFGRMESFSEKNSIYKAAQQYYQRIDTNKHPPNDAEFFNASTQIVYQLNYWAMRFSLL